jgi:predicted ATPase/DNA-binding CsgD family transcriptional regulator
VHGLVGRDAEVEAVTGLLRGPVRLLTLTGPPGVGKTRLALEMVNRLEDRFADGAAFADLSGAADRAAAVGALATAVGVVGGVASRTGQRLHHSLVEREMLLVLDNAEQVAGLALELVAILQDCRHVRLLVTSRVPMHVSAEREFPLRPLAVPTADDAEDLERLAATASVALVVLAARAVRPGFAVTTANAAAVGEICRRLDGLPLALTLAAAQLKVFGANDVAARLRDRSTILEATNHDVPPRHRSLRAAISWSHDVLSAEERRLFRRVAVFHGRWSLDAAERVCRDGSDDTRALVLSLVDKSLVQRVDVDSQEASFALLDSLREYAVEQLGLHREQDAVTARLTSYCVDGARLVERALGTAREGALSGWAADHEGDLRAALARCLTEGDAEGALVLATALGWAWYTRGHLALAAAALAEALTAADGAATAPDPASLAAARTVTGVVAWGRNDLVAAEELLDSARAACAERGDDRRQAIACAFLGHVARERGALDLATRRHEEAARLFDRSSSPRGSAWSRFDLGRVVWQRGDLGQAAELFREALHGFRDAGYAWAVAWGAWALGTVEAERGRPDDGLRLLAESFALFDAEGDLRGCAAVCECLATVAAERGEQVPALHLVGVAARLRRNVGVPPSRTEERRVAQVESAARRVLGEYRAERERQAGRRMPLVSAHRIVGQLVASGDRPGARGPAADTLTPREREVASLVAEGWSNQQIGRRLGMAARTAEAHLHHIMGKLDARSRSEVAVWAVRNGLAPER